MRVLICLRPNAPEDRGGDWLQLEATLPHLRALGVQAEYSVDAHPDFAAYDLCLIWNTVEPLPALYAYFEARRQKKPVAIMPIHWSLEKYLDVGVRWDEAMPDARTMELERLRREVNRTRQSILMQGADGLLPLSPGEAECLRRDFGAPAETLRLVHYGIDTSYGAGNAQRFIERQGVRDFILCIGFLSPRKNQLNLIRALQDDPRPLVLMGDVEAAEYAEYCQKAAAKRAAPTHFLPRQDSSVVADALAAARVHAILSWYDVGPLVALEAAQAGCPQVVTTECGMPEYLGDEVMYADPEDLDGIRRAVDAEWEQPRAVGLAKRLRGEFTWERSAREIAGALEWTLEHPRAVPDATLELVRAGDLTQQETALTWELAREQGASIDALAQWLKQAQAEAQETGAHAAQLETWAHEMEAENVRQKETLERILNLPPVRATRYLRKRLLGSDTNGQGH